MKPPASIYIAFDVFPRPKGSSSHIASMVAALSRHYAPVWLLCLGYGDLPAYQEEGDVVILRYKVYHPNLLKRAAEFAGFVAATASRAGAGVKLVVFRDPFGGVSALEALDAPAVFEVNALPSWELPYTYPEVGVSPALLAKLEDQERFCLAASSRVLTVSGVTREALIGLGVSAEKIAVIPNAAAATFFKAGAAGPLPEVDADNWFGYVGSLHPWQGLPLALEAFALAAPDLPQARMVVVHNGRKGAQKLMAKRARKLGIEDRVRFEFPLGPEQLAAVLHRLRFTVAPLLDTPRNTVQGCCPVKIVESFAAGAPVVASDLRVCRELVSPERDGLLVPPGSERAWAIAFRRMFTAPGLAAKLGQGARETAQNRFTWQNIHARLEKVFASAAESPPEVLSAPRLVPG